MKEVKLSVIVPIYNAAEYISRCVESILKQTECSIELILINDGSTDNSGYICDTYASADARVKVIHQKNAGVSVARNVGIKEASGEYIGFVDADDWILEDMYEQLLKHAIQSQAEIVMCDAFTAYSDGKKEIDTINQLLQNSILSSCELKPRLLVEMAGSACRCVYQKKLINEYQVRFPEGIKFSEDRIFNIYAMGYAKKIYYVKQAFYMRYINVNSVVHRFHSDYFQLVKDGMNGVKKALADAWKNDELYQIAYLHQFIDGSLAAINNYFYKTSKFSLKQQIDMVYKVCNDKELHNAIVQTNASGIRKKAIIKKRVLFLCICAKLANWKSKR